MEYVKAQQSRFANAMATQQNLAHLAADERSITAYIGSHRDGPVSQLVPRQQVTSEGQSQSEQEQEHTNHPVELARLFIRAGVEHPAHMEKDADHHAVGRPAMHVSEERAHEHDKLQILHVLVSLRRVRPVIAHQRDPGLGENHEEKEGDETKIETVLEP